MKPSVTAGFLFVGLLLVAAASSAGADWTQFRGPGGSGISSDASYSGFGMGGADAGQETSRDLGG